MSSALCGYMIKVTLPNAHISELRNYFGRSPITYQVAALEVICPLDWVDFRTAARLYDVIRGLQILSHARTYTRTLML